MGGYFAPYIDATGLHIATYQQIEAYELAQFLSVYGQNVYDGDDSADIQWIDIFSLMINDAFGAAQLAYNARSPVTAVGTDLDAVVAINGITRKPAVNSTAIITIAGVANTVITNGAVADLSGNLWALPTTVTIPNGGSINVQATCLTSGAISAAANSINTPSQGVTQGWNSATNPAPAVLGVPVETDSQLRARQAISVSPSSKTLVQQTIAAIAAVAGVTRYATGIPTNPVSEGTSVENPTGSVDSFGNPAHSITMVVEGGANLDIATAIYNNKTPGCLTNGTTLVPVTDPNSGATMNIGFYRPTYTTINVAITVNPFNGYTSATGLAIQAALTNYLNSLQIGQLVSISALEAIAMSVNQSLLTPQFSVTSLTANSGTTDIAIAYNAVSEAGTITLTS
jgi:uncharacterized phage protein gp47/JayE